MRFSWWSQHGVGLTYCIASAIDCAKRIEQ